MHFCENERNVTRVLTWTKDAILDDSASIPRSDPEVPEGVATIVLPPAAPRVDPVPLLVDLPLLRPPPTRLKSKGSRPSRVFGAGRDEAKVTKPKAV